MFCNHKRKPAHRPNAICSKCWYSYLNDNPDNVITARDALRMMEAFHVKALDFKVDEMWRTWES